MKSVNPIIGRPLFELEHISGFNQYVSKYLNYTLSPVLTPFIPTIAYRAPWTLCFITIISRKYVVAYTEFTPHLNLGIKIITPQALAELKIETLSRIALLRCPLRTHVHAAEFHSAEQQSSVKMIVAAHSVTTCSWSFCS